MLIRVIAHYPRHCIHISVFILIFQILQDEEHERNREKQAGSIPV